MQPDLPCNASQITADAICVVMLIPIAACEWALLLYSEAAREQAVDVVVCMMAARQQI